MTAGWEEIVLAGWRRGQKLGAVGPGPVEDHLAHARGLAAALPGAVLAELGWSDRVQAVHERAEVAGRGPEYRRRFGVVTARSFGPPAVTAECAAPFVGTGGAILFAEPPASEESGRWPADGLAHLGLVAGPRLARPSVQVLVAEGELDDRFPRKPGVAARRPLW